MKKARMTLLLGAALVIAAGCSTAPVADNQPAYELDYKRMALIEAVAANRRAVAEGSGNVADSSRVQPPRAPR